ncbi:MAG: NAD-dependent epimerase/dehydratase family protein, partial [Candidatus Aenigmatarchaeota archaeon]
EENLPEHPNFTFYECDLVEQKQKLLKIMKKEKPSIVYHYAAINGTKFFYDIPYKLISNNIDITKNVLEGCKLIPLKKIIYASSSEIYGTPKTIPTSEKELISLNLFADRDSYATSKAVGEFYVRLFAEKHNKDYLIFRIFNTYGPRMDTSATGQVIPEFVRKITKDDVFTIIGNGKFTRSFCYVDDHVRLVIKLAETQSNDIFNVGDDDEITINKLAETMHKILNRKFKPKYLPARPYDHPRRCPDISKMINVINDKPKISLEEGLERTIKGLGHCYNKRDRR